MAEAGIQKLIQEGLTIKADELLAKPVGDMTTEEAVYAASILDVIAKKIEPRCKELKERLKAEANARGQPDPDGKGHKILTLLDGAGVTVQKKVASLPDDTELKALLAAREIPVKKVYDEVPTFVLNAAKLDFLVQAGKISVEEVSKMKKVTYSVLIDKPEPVANLLEEAKKGKKK